MAGAPGFGPHSYEIITAQITSDRNPGNVMDITQAISGISLYEHLEIPYMTGELTLIDTVDIMNMMGYRGTEKFTFSARYGNPEFSFGTFDKTFIITSVQKSMKTNDNVEVILMAMVEESFFLGSLDTVSREFTGKPNVIIDNILKNSKSGKTLEVRGTPEVQTDMRYLAPYVSSFTAMDIVRDASTTQEGLPFFLYSTPWEKDKLFYESLDNMLSSGTIVSSYAPFRYSLYSTGLSDAHLNGRFGGDGNIDPRERGNDQRRQVAKLEHASSFIERYSVTNTHNTLSMIQRGNIGSRREFVNINEFDFREQHFSIKETLDRLKPKMPTRQQRMSYDEVSHGGMHTKDSRNITNIFASHTYTDFMNNIYDTGPELGGFLPLHSTKDALKHMMETTAIDIQVPGYHFWPKAGGDTNRSIGRLIPLRFFNNDTEFEGRTGNSSTIDPERSGEYLMFAANHMFSTEKYSVALTAVKYSNLD